MRPEFLVAMKRLGVVPEALDRALDSVSFGVIVNHVEDGCIYASEEALRVFDLEWDAFKGFGWMSSVIPADVEALRGSFERYQEGDAQSEVQYRISVSDGSVRAIVATASRVLDADGRQLGSVVVGRVATAERAAAERGVQSQKLEAIGRLAGRVAHDFNNVLTPIICSASLLESESLSAEGRECVATIVQGVQHAAAITRQLLGLSRQGDGAPRVARLDDEVASMRTMLGQMVGEEIELTLDLQAKGSVIALAPHELGQVLLNLCVNGRDAVNGDGRVCVSTRLAGSFLELRVHDSGVGISLEVQQRMFEPFYTTKASDRGTGLGLSTARDLVRRAGGDITVHSELGSGTEMLVMLPSLVSSAVPEPPARRGVEVPPQRILLVDDNAALRQTLAYVLALRRHDVKTSASFARASDMLREGAFDVLVTDVLLPDGRGDDLASLAIEAQPELGIVYITGFAGEDFERVARGDTSTVFLQKPFHPNEVVDAIAQVLLANRAAGSA
ncbi:MAG: response regulator [Nannocystaceae bacterium]|nr:response regulator [Nannocystaceae bacterium]